MASDPGRSGQRIPASYSDGHLVPPKPGASADPKPCAGNKGTQITVEDLFYNVTTRRKALKNANEEYGKIMEVVTKYAIHNSSTAFNCKKVRTCKIWMSELPQGASTVDINTPSGTTPLDNIRALYGAPVAKELLPVSFENTRWQYKASGHISNANYNTKKMVFLLFINHRLVESSSLKKGIEQLYAAYLPKGTHPFAYLSLEISPEIVDVNVHPTKREVHFLNEEKIVETVCEAMQEKLANANQSRTYFTQTFLPGASPPKTDAQAPPKKTASSTRAPEHKLVRTDSRTRTLDAFMTAEAPIARNRVADNEDVEMVDVEKQDSSQKAKSRHPFVEVRLTSVLRLREQAKLRGHKGMTDLFRNHIFVGFSDDRYALVQFETKLYLVDCQDISREFFYQMALGGFSNFGCINLSIPGSIHELVIVALDAEDPEYWDKEDMMSKEKIAESVVDLLVSRRVMLEEYFSFKVSEEGDLLALPVLLKGYMPNVSKLPRFLLRLKSEVSWETEQQCFETFCRELAEFYAVEAPIALPDAADESIDEEMAGYFRSLEHALFPAMKAHLVVPEKMAASGAVLQLANLPDLYRVFERC
ncbi:DNA mismatch repair protein [Blyttiomyces helicus]|uniref:DNA mismatch repair protein n=1 Tax=Blyttiomyces helicus TaxID=388810 RepID=A0A4P9W4J9_9FUNG|nr:DNA mismatch repair protein [Blyttiomyces helicus]|eukprot:RKO85788.1 DNA mismatch repair protein [Blyttiomyces helicus]